MTTPVDARPSATRPAADTAAATLFPTAGLLADPPCPHRHGRPATVSELPDPVLVAEAHVCAHCSSLLSIRLRGPHAPRLFPDEPDSNRTQAVAA
ncbi:MAG: hypothetical protein WD805_05575 [Gaiellaceae bacterium]